MLFYNQLKREFLTSVWKKGQSCFLERQVADVRMMGHRVVGQVAGLETTITTARGTVTHSVCGCTKTTPLPAGTKHCEHAAALAIWVVEKGSLLRAGISDPDEGTADSGPNGSNPAPAQKAAANALIAAEPIAYVRGLFEGKKMTALSVEAALRYKDPDTGENQLKTLTYLTHKPDLHAYRTAQGHLLKLSHDSIPVIQNMEAAKLIYQGRAALENLAKLLEHGGRKQIVFHEDLDLEIADEPLKLETVHIGRAHEKGRALSLVYSNSKIKIDSDDLQRLSDLGRLGDSTAWLDDKKIYRLTPSLHQVYQYANRTGVAALEGGDPAKAHQGFAYLHDDDEYPLHPLAVYRLSLELGVEDFTVDTDWKEFHEWRANFEKKKIDSLPRTDYGFDLRDYQTNGLKWMWSLYHRGLGALLADDMGLGKTHQVLAFLKSVYIGKGKLAPSLVVAPTSVVAAWKQKLEKYPTGLNWHVFHGNARKLPKDDVQVILTTYGILQREPLLRARKWQIVVMDEAQAIKNATTISSRAARTLKSSFRIAMTGTPVENQSTDLWSVIEFILPGYLGSLPRFKRLYGSGRDIPTQDQASALKRLVSPFLLRRTKTQVLKELPEKTEEVILCELTTAQKKAYRAALESSEAERIRENIQSGERINYVNVLALLTRLKQICDHPRLPDFSSGRLKKITGLKPEDSGKWEAVEELIEEALRSDLKVVIFTQYLGMLDMLSHSLKQKGVGHTELRGDTQDRAARLHKFAHDPECRIFLCSLLAGGLGIDLTSASVCIHLDRWWNPAKENQATDRLHRIGQTRGVQVFKMQIEGTVEERIAQIIESKTALSHTLIEESSAALKAFSREQLLELLKLPSGV